MSNSVIGFFLDVGAQPDGTGRAAMKLADDFYPFIWGRGGVDGKCKKLLAKKYGKDIKLILFELHLKPSRDELKIIKPFAAHRKKEKAISVPIVINNRNFLALPSKKKGTKLRQILIDAISLLQPLVESKKLDLDVAALEMDLKRVWSR